MVHSVQPDALGKLAMLGEQMAFEPAEEQAAAHNPNAPAPCGPSPAELARIYGDANAQVSMTQQKKNALKEMAKKLKIASALVDFAQVGFAADQLIDGKPNNAKGWAVVPNTGITHWVIFQLKEPISYDAGTVFTFRLLHRHSLADHTIGRFRLSATTNNKAPLPIGLADEFRSILELPVAEQTEKQRALLTRMYQLVDPEMQKRQQELATTRMPLSIDPKVKELKTTLTELAKPVPLDGKLAQLRLDGEQSKQQMANPRLTAAQDLAWALINSPAFLFNH
jgi:hypothetical protein